MSISAKQVKELKDKTGIGLMECKKALKETDGDLKEAVDILRKRGLAKAEKKAGRDVKEGRIHSYIHPGGKIGVLVEINCETDFVAKTDDFKEFCKNIAMHIAASDPLAVDRESIDQDTVEKEKEIFEEQAKEENKPEHIIPRIVEGKVNKFYEENCLLEQEYVKNPDIAVKEYVKQTIARIGENMDVARFTRYKLGE
ncbi:MAG TPA: translation elongation factor Ts [bacterium]|nr:translation elongation factor Ts [bacterium]